MTNEPPYRSAVQENFRTTDQMNKINRHPANVVLLV